jgi:peptide/nickel transport system permease protein
MVMYAGEVVETGNVRSVIKNPQHPYTRALLRSSSVGVEPRQPLPVIGGSVPAPGSWPTWCRFASRCELVHDRCTSAPIPLVHTDDDASARCVLATSTLQGAK